MSDNNNDDGNNSEISMESHDDSEIDVILEDGNGSAFLPPKASKGIRACKTKTSNIPSATVRHNKVPYVEPKVFLQHKNRNGHVPRKIEVERRIRMYAAVDITRNLKDNGVIQYLESSLSKKIPDPFGVIPLTSFDNTDFEDRPIESWKSLIQEFAPMGLPARAKCVMEMKNNENPKEIKYRIIWRKCRVSEYDSVTKLFSVYFEEPVVFDRRRGKADGEGIEENKVEDTAFLDSLYICFDGEDPTRYCNRLLDALNRKKLMSARMGLNLYVDCMPIDNLRPLDSEQVTRILAAAVNMEALRVNSLLDTASLVQQYNLNHMRSLNKLILIHNLKHRLQDIKMVQTISTDVVLLDNEIQFKMMELRSIPDYNYEEKKQAFKFNSFWNMIEALKIIAQIQVDNTNLERQSFFNIPEKTVRTEDYTLLLQQSTNITTQNLRELWVNSIIQSVRINLKDVKKGWFNTEESNLEVYNFSKLRRFLYRINFMMEDTIRNMLMRNLSEYGTAICRYCPTEIIVHNHETVTVKGGRSSPLFVVDLKFIQTPATATTEASAQFLYSASPEALLSAVMAPFEQIFELLKGIIKVERKVMKKLFWSHDPTIGIPHPGEPWVNKIRENTTSALNVTLQPMRDYLLTLKDFTDLISIDVKQYAADAEKKFCPGETMNLAELCALAKKHARDADEIFQLLPSAVNLGFVVIDCTKVKSTLSAKHKSISTKLFEVTERKTREYAESILKEFRVMYDHVTVVPTSIEHLTELREYMASLPQQIDQLNDRMATNEEHFNLLEKARCQISHEQMDIRWDVFGWPLKMSQELTKKYKNLNVLEVTFRSTMQEEQEEFLQEVQGLQIDVSKLKDLIKLSAAVQNAETVRRLKKNISKAEEKARLFNSREGLFNAPVTEYVDLAELGKTFEPFFDLWDCADKWLSNKENWTNGAFMELDAEVVENTVVSLQKNLNKSAKYFERINLPKCLGIASEVRAEVDAFRPKVPLITNLRNPGMRERHWKDLSDKIAKPIDKSKLTLQYLCDLGLVDLLPEVEKVSEKAGKEFTIEMALDKMLKAWETVQLVIEPYRETGTFILKGIDECMNLLDEHITATQAMAFSAFKGPFADRIDKWNTSLVTVSEVFDEWVQLQRNWLYLQPIFDSPDINKQLPLEGKRFATVDKYWRQTMASAQKGVYAIRFCDSPSLLEKFKDFNKSLELVQKGLADYLETKRAGFSRFYFLSNDELLEILSETKDPLRVQPHLRKCFEGIKSVDFQPDLTITGMVSPEGEKVSFVKPVDPKNKNIEVWMVEVLEAMIAGVRNNLIHALIDYVQCSRTDWMQKWAGQCVLNGSQFHWTKECEEAIRAKGNEGVWDYYRKLVQQLSDMVILIRGKISKAARTTVGALAVIDVHARDVQKKMAEAGVSDVTDFDWISQMRYYWEQGTLSDFKGDLSVIMVSSKRWYGYEYLGNSFRLVITPLTDKCYLTLMGALQMILGGAPAGPAGTGKTETTKDMAKALAKQCVVFNCSDGLDYLAMGKFFKGLASSGAWACFDEFNRINIEVLSVIAQQVIHLQGAVQRNEKRTIFEGTDIFVNPEFAVYITMNPGYAGRAELPDNLEALFRPVAMMVPDYALIGEIMLFSYGYMENRKCAQKMVATFRLCSEQLSSQDHYDYGMRAVKTVITAAGNLKRASPDENEEALLMRALQDVNVPKFLAHDLPLFYGILSDLFPGVARPAFDYGPLLTSIKDCIAELNLQPIEIFIRKNIELYEMICVRHGLMVVGPTGGGKSSNIRVLCNALTKLKDKGVVGERFERTRILHLNPKSIRMGQLYGEFDENTHEWQDGILCVLIRQCIREDNSNLKWMLFDGPVDAIWIENMNTVLDDNKKLCLTSGEIIQLSEPMTMMFEPEDLAVASPATVSRCGMIYMEPNSLGYDVLFQSWLNTIPVCFGNGPKGKLQKLFDAYVPSFLPHLRRNLVEPLPTVNNCLVEGLLKLIDTFFHDYHDKEDGSEKKSPEQVKAFLEKLESIFMFCLIWSLCCTVNSTSRKFWDAFVRAEMFANGAKNHIPADGSIYDYKFDVASNSWVHWTKSVEPYKFDPKLSFSELIIPTKDSICYTYLLDILVRNSMHVLMTGPTGTGKTVNILGHLMNGLPDKYIPITLAFSAQTGANQTQDLIDSKCEKRRKGVFGPSAGKQFIIFVDDVNMPMKEEYGAQPPIEILRQWFDNGGWYDRKALEMRKIIDIVFVCACGPPGGGRNHVTARFYRHFNIINYVSMSDDSLSLIFTTILSNFLSSFEAEVQTQAAGLVKATVSLYNTILEDLLPTPARPHYLFNMRDLSKVFQGMLMCDKKRVATPEMLARLWVHENSRVFGDRLINTSDKDWLNQTLEKKLTENTHLAWSTLWESKADVVYTDFMIPGADPKVYEEIEDLPALQAVIEEYLGEYNAESRQPMNLVMFKDAMSHVAKITRVLRQPSGHALLLGVGGSGRQSLTRLASFISEYKCYQIEIAKGYGMNEWRENVKECLLLAGLQGKYVVFLFNDTQIVNETMLEDLNGVLNSGDVPNLYSTEDLENIATAFKPECARKKIPPTKINLFAQYLNRVKANLHVVLCMSPLGDAFRSRIRKFPSIVNCCTIDWFMEWPEDALQSVAARFLASANLGLSPDLDKNLIIYFQFIHQSIEKASVEFLNTMRRRFYVTPTSYLELLSTYNEVLNFKRKEVGTLRDRLSKGVDKLVSTEKAVNELKASLIEMEPILIKTQAEVEAMIITITEDKKVAAATKSQVQVEEKVASEKAEHTKGIADSAQRDLDEALPALAEAVQCLQDLKKADLDEVKSFSKPSPNVILTMKAVCIMFSIKAEKINDPDNPGKKKEDYFGTAKKTVLVDGNKLLNDMKDYDKDNISRDVITVIEPLYNDPNFTPEVIEKSSKACKAMCMWVRAMYKYHQVTLVVEPKKKQLAEAQLSLDETMKTLQAAQTVLKGAEDKIAALEASFKSANDKKEQLVYDVEQCRSRLDRAVKLMSGLGGERTRWTSSCANLSTSFECLVGDSLVSSGTIAYLGVFTPDFRQKIVKLWQDKLEELQIPHTKHCNLRFTLSDQVAIRLWTICGLPQDSHSVENGIIMSKARRYPLLIDPQGQANRFIKNMGADQSLCPNSIEVVKLSDKNFLRKLENGVRYGQWILLENIGEQLDAALEPLLLQQKFKQGGTVMIKIGDSTIPWNDSFKFFMTTKLSNPHYPPEVCVKVSLVNFAITLSGLEDQLLGVVVVEELPEMEQKKNDLVVSNARMRKELQELEDTILYMLSNSTGNILDDHKLIETLATSKVKSQEITIKVQEAEKTEVEIDETRNMYRPVAYRGAILYFCVADLGNVDPMYQYSLQWFKDLFVQAIRLAEQAEVVEARLKNLNEFFTYYVYINICRSLFERHKLLFAFLLTIRILQGDNQINALEWMFLISGKSLASLDLPNPSPDWIDGRMWSEFLALSSLPAFEGLAEDVCKNTWMWRVIYDSLDPHLQALPSRFDYSLSSFQKISVLRCIRADRVPDSVILYVIEQLGQRFVEPPPFDLAACYKDSNILTPLIFVLSKGSDPTKGFNEFSTKMKMDRKTKMLSLGQGQGPKAVKMIEEATQKGLWVFLQNCHLYISWLSELERLCEGLTPETTHKDFRLWLTSMPCAEFPVAVLQMAVKMTNEPPKGMKANLRSAYFKLNNNLLNVTKKPNEYKKILFGLCFFHAVVQERRQFGPLGWNIPYEFNDTDLDISKGQLELFLDQYAEIPWKVLNFLTSYINYGGRVTDYIDLRTIDIILKSFYNPRILEAGYKFDPDGIFYSIEFNETDPHASYLQYIEQLPLVASPQVFGMHENAKIASANNETFSMFDICLSLQANDSGGGGASGMRERLIETAAKDIFHKIQAKGQFDIEAISMLYPVTYEESMNTVLLQECIRYNKLIDAMEESLPMLLKALKGLVGMSAELDAISNSIAVNQVPKMWASKAYPSLKPLSAWVDDLMARLEFILEWIDEGVPIVFWISGFYFPQSFLTGSLQNFARKNHLPIDTVSFDFIVTDTPWEQIRDKKEDGVLIRGLFLEGARWDAVLESLNDSLPKQLYTDLPVLHLNPIQYKQDRTMNVYRCPVYKILSRRGVLATTGHSTNFIMWIDLPSKRTEVINFDGKADQEEWIKAGVGAFSSLMY